MKEETMKKVSVFAVCLTASLLLAGCNSYSYKPVATDSPNQRVRLVTISDEDGAVVGERYEMFDLETSSWFEAENSENGGWGLTSAGARAKSAAQSSSSSSGSSSSGGSC